MSRLQSLGEAKAHWVIDDGGLDHRLLQMILEREVFAFLLFTDRDEDMVRDFDPKTISKPQWYWLLCAVDSGNGVFGEGFLAPCDFTYLGWKVKNYHERKSRVRPSSRYGCFLKWWYPPFHTPKWSFLVGKPMVVGETHHFRKHPYESQEPLVTFFFHKGPWDWTSSSWRSYQLSLRGQSFGGKNPLSNVRRFLLSQKIKEMGRKSDQYRVAQKNVYPSQTWYIRRAQHVKERFISRVDSCEKEVIFCRSFFFFEGGWFSIATERTSSKLYFWVEALHFLEGFGMVWIQIGRRQQGQGKNLKVVYIKVYIQSSCSIWVAAICSSARRPDVLSHSLMSFKWSAVYNIV